MPLICAITETLLAYRKCFLYTICVTSLNWLVLIAWKGILMCCSDDLMHLGGQICCLHAKTMQACHPLSFKTSVKLSNPMRMFTKHTTPHLSLPRLMGGCLTVILLSNSIVLKPRSFWLKSYFQPQSEGSGGEKVLPEIDSFFSLAFKAKYNRKKFSIAFWVFFY